MEYWIANKKWSLNKNDFFANDCISFNGWHMNWSGWIDVIKTRPTIQKQDYCLVAILSCHKCHNIDETQILLLFTWHGFQFLQETKEQEEQLLCAMGHGSPQL